MKSRIMLQSGEFFDFQKPELANFTIEDIAHGLSNICRFVGHTRQFYSVAQHSVLVSRNVAKVFAYEALMHDAAEAFLGDVSAPLKQILPDYKKIEEAIERVVFRKFNLPVTLAPEVKEADLYVCALEKRDLMPKNKAYLEEHTGIPLKGEKIIPLCPELSKSLFLMRFLELC